MAAEDLKFIITQVGEKHPNYNYSEVYALSIDLDYGRALGDAEPFLASGDIDLKVGDVVELDSKSNFTKKHYPKGVRAVVIGARPRADLDGRILTIFSPQIGEHKISLLWNEKYSYTETGHEVIVEKRAGNKNNEYYEIVDNLTINKMRADFLTRQR